jgi:putative endonuclease
MVAGRIEPTDDTKFTAWMYILECSDGSYYVGSTKDLDFRSSEHQAGKGAKYTSRRLPVKLVYSEEYERVVNAYAREKQIQNWSRAKREALINGKLEILPQPAKKDFARNRK